MYIYGKNVAKEKIDSGEKINKIYLSDKFNDRELIELIKKNKIKFVDGDYQVLEKKLKI